MDIKKMKAAVIDALEEIKAKNIVMLNVSKLTSLFDYLVVASGDSNRQTRALASNVKDRLKELGASVVGSEGEESGDWVLVDLGDIVVHVMQPAIRDYYHLEELWREGKIEYPKPALKKVTTKKPAGTKAPGAATAKPKLKVKPKAKPKVSAKTKTKVKTKTKTKTTSATTRKTHASPITTKNTVAKSKSGVKPASGAKKTAATATRRKTKA